MDVADAENSVDRMLPGLVARSGTAKTSTPSSMLARTSSLFEGDAVSSASLMTRLL
jgi:hypothetical protein